MWYSQTQLCILLNVISLYFQRHILDQPEDGPTNLAEKYVVGIKM